MKCKTASAGPKLIYQYCNRNIIATIHSEAFENY